MAKKKKNPYADAAETSALLRYGPETSVLAQLLRDAEERRDTSTRQATSGRQYSVGAVDQALPQVRQAYAGAAQAIHPAFAQQGGIESAALTARMGESQAQAQSQLAARRVSAFEGESAAKQQALRDYASDRGKIGARALDLSQERGAYVGQQVTEMAGADAAAQEAADKLAAQINNSRGNALIGAGLLPDGSAPIPGGRLDPNAPQNQPKTPKTPKKTWATPAAQGAAGDEIQRLLTEANENKSAGENRHEVLGLLLQGVPKSKAPIYETVDDGKGGKKRQKKLVRDASGNLVEATTDDPGFQAAKSRLLAQAAIDMAYDGHLSRRTQSLLHARKIQLKPLGLVTFNEWLKTPAGVEWKRKQRAGKRGGPVGVNAPGGHDGTGGGGT